MVSTYNYRQIRCTKSENLNVYPSETHLKLKSREMSFVHNIRVSSPIDLKVSLSCPVQNLKTIRQLHNKLWTNGNPQDLSLRYVSGGYPILHKTPGWSQQSSGVNSWWRHQMETFSALLAICAGNSPVPGEFPTQRPVTRSFDAFFDMCLNKRLSKQSWGWWFETPSRPLWRHYSVRHYFFIVTNIK